MTSTTRLIKECGIYRDKFIGIYHYKETDKIAITDSGMLYLQSRTLCRYFSRKYNGQNSLRLDQYIKKEILGDYFQYLGQILSLYSQKYREEDYIILLNANHNLLVYMRSPLILLEQQYSMIRDREYIHDTLLETIKKLELFREKFRIILNQS